MADHAKPSFETLKANDSGRRLVSQSGRHEVEARILTDRGREYLILRRWVGSHPAPNATAPWSEPSWSQHIALDDDLNIVATGWGGRERDSFAMLSKALAVKGIQAGDPAKSRIKHVNPEYADVSTSTLRHWLGYWSDPVKSQAEADAKGITRGSEIDKLTAEIEGRGFSVGYSKAGNAHDALKERLTWKPGDVDVLTPEQAADVLGVGPEDS